MLYVQKVYLTVLLESVMFHVTEWEVRKAQDSLVPFDTRGTFVVFFATCSTSFHDVNDTVRY
jgi:hypothetical protein